MVYVHCSADQRTVAMRQLLLILTLVTLPSVSYAYEPGSVGALLHACEIYDDEAHLNKAIADNDHDEVTIHMLESGDCNGYFRGTRDTYDLSNLVIKDRYSNARIVCIPKHVANEQIYKIFIKYANKYPARWHERAGGVVMSSLLDAFPCPK